MCFNVNLVLFYVGFIVIKAYLYKTEICLKTIKMKFNQYENLICFFSVLYWLRLSNKSFILQMTKNELKLELLSLLSFSMGNYVRIYMAINIGNEFQKNSFWITHVWLSQCCSFLFICLFHLLYLIIGG